MTDATQSAQAIAREALAKTDHLYRLFREYGDDAECSGRIGYALAADLIEDMRRIAALPGPSVPEVGSIVIDTSTPLRTRHVVQEVQRARVWIGPEGKKYAQEHHEWLLDAAWCARFTPAPESA